MDDITRIARIDALADRWLARGDERPATEVWDAAAQVVDTLDATYGDDGSNIVTP